MAPWLDKRGAFAPFKTVAFVALFAPGAWLAYEYLWAEAHIRRRRAVALGRGHAFL